MGSVSATSLNAEAGTRQARLPRPNRKLLTAVGFWAAGLVLLLVGAVSYHSARMAHERTTAVAHTQQVLHAIQELLNLITDAETGQRGFILTGRDEYLEPFERAQKLYPPSWQRLQSMTADNPRQQEHLARFKQFADEKMALLGLAPDLRVDAERLRASIESGVGKRLMDQIRIEVESMNRVERDLLERRTQESRQSANVTQVVILSGFALSLALIFASFLLLRQEGLERDRAEAQVRALNTRLERHAHQLEVSNRELEGFSYSVSHDLRIPLRAVAGYSQMLQEDFADVLGPEGLRMLGMVRTNAANMNELIDDLLTFSRLGNKELVTTALDMNQLVAATVQQCTSPVEPIREPGNSQAQANEAPEVVVHGLPEARGDSALLRQVWLNLVSNALKYSATRNPPRIEVSGSVQGDEVVYQIRDNGVGFDMRYASKLFGVFQRLHAADEFSGTGVGLAIVQRIISRHGGRVWADARLNEGATFSFTLPLAPAQGAAGKEGPHAAD